MPTIDIMLDDDSNRRIVMVGEWPDPETAIEAHGYDPSVVEWSVDDPDSDLQDAIKNASNLQELKDALTDSKHPAQARSRKG